MYLMSPQSAIYPEEKMKKTVSVLLTLALLFGLVLALPSAPARAESTPEQELTEAFQNLNAVDSMRMDLDIVLDLSIVMSMGTAWAM